MESVILLSLVAVLAVTPSYASGGISSIPDLNQQDIGLLDLSGRDMTSTEVYSALAARKAQGRPVTTLILSNSRIYPMDAGTFAAAEGTINTLVMANTSVNLDALHGLTNLKVLNLSNNALSTFPWYGLMTDTLEVLDLSQNRYEEVRPELSMLRNLRELYLSNNKIMHVEWSPLALLSNLETLDLSMNVLGEVNLAGLTNLKRLNLDSNDLRWMNGWVCRIPSQRLTLKIAYNPWDCDCGLLHARDNNDILDLDQLQCSMQMGYEGFCPNCPTDTQAVSVMTKDSIYHRDCFDIQDIYIRMIGVRIEDPQKFFLMFVVYICSPILFILAVTLIVVKGCCKKTINRKHQQIPHIQMIGKSQEVAYIK